MNWESFLRNCKEFLLTLGYLLLWATAGGVFVVAFVAWVNLMDYILKSLHLL